MPHWRTYMDNDNEYLAAWELTGDTVATIAKVGSVTPRAGEGKKSGRRLGLKFAEPELKPMISNPTNNKTIERMYGDDPAAWVGKKITLYPSTCDAFGNPNTPCIRVRPQVPK